MDSHLLTLHFSGEHCDLAIVPHCQHSPHLNTDWNLVRKKVCSRARGMVAELPGILLLRWKKGLDFSVCLVSMATQCSTVPNFYLQWNMLHWKVLFCPNFVGGGSNCCHPYASVASLCMSKEEVEVRNQLCGQCVKCFLSRQVWHLTEVSGCGKTKQK